MFSHSPSPPNDARRCIFRLTDGIVRDAATGMTGDKRLFDRSDRRIGRRKRRQKIARESATFAKQSFASKSLFNVGLRFASFTLRMNWAKRGTDCPFAWLQM